MNQFLVRGPGLTWRFDSNVPESYLRREGDVISLIQENEVLEAILNYSHDQVKEGYWIPKKGKLKKIKEFGSTVLSGFASESEVQRRFEICKTCPMLRSESDGFYCSGCSCGVWKLSNLEGRFLPKLGWKRSPCPMHKF